MRIEKKKHVSQMTNYEISKIQKKVGRLSVSMLIGSMSEYARNRAFEKGIDINEERLSRWLESDIIEYKTVYYKFLNKLEERVVIRSNYDNAYDVVIVLNVNCHKIVTMWKNKRVDTHKTLDLTKYDKKLKIS